jgi:ionotropic kainate glutamate receptor 2
MLEDDGNKTGNARYKGFCVDLLKHIAKMQGFDYKIQLVKDNKYGVYHPDSKEWDGIVNELIQGVSTPHH